jgi:membrane fusion protein (multidrug efflux system)
MSESVPVGRRSPGALGQRLDGFPWAQYGTPAATVTRVATEARDGAIRVELDLAPQTPTAIPLQHGLPGTVEVTVEHVSPATMVLRGVGARFHRAATHTAAVGRQAGIL